MNFVNDEDHSNEPPFELNQDQCDIFFALRSNHPLWDTLQAFGKYLREPRSAIQPNSRVIPIKKEYPAWLTVWREAPCAEGFVTTAQGHIFSEVKLTRKWPWELIIGEIQVSFRKPSQLRFQIKTLFKQFQVYSISSKGDVEEKLFLTQSEIDSLYKAKSIEIEPVVQVEQGEAVLQEVRAEKMEIEASDIKQKTGDEESLSRQAAETADTSNVFKNLPTDISEERERLLKENEDLKASLEEKDTEIDGLKNTLKTELEKKDLEISTLQTKVLDLETRLQQMVDRIDAMEKAQNITIHADSQSSPTIPFDASAENTAPKKRVIHHILKKPKLTSDKTHQLDMNQSDRIMKQFDTEPHQEESSGLFTQLFCSKPPSIDPQMIEAWHNKLKFRVLGQADVLYNPHVKVNNRTGNEAEQAGRLDGEIIDEYMQQLEQMVGSETIMFDTIKAEQILGKGSSKLKPKTDFLGKKFIIVPVWRKDGGGHWALLIIVSNNCNWLTPPFNIESYYLDSAGFVEPPEATKKVLKYLLHSVKAKSAVTEASSIDFSVEICSKKVSIIKQVNNKDCGVLMLHYLRLFLQSENRSKFLTLKHDNPNIHKNKLISDERESIFQALRDAKGSVS